MKNRFKCCLLLLLFGVFFTSCDDDDGSSHTEDLGEVSDLSDSESEADGGDLDAIAEIPEEDLKNDDARDFQTDKGEDSYDFGEDIAEPPSETAWACDASMRIAACESAILGDGATMPVDAADLLFYVNRWYSIPSDYPIPSDSLWTPCEGSPAPVENDLVCLPDGYGITGRDFSLRQVAWESDPPVDYTLTYDGLEVGYQGKVGFKPMLDAALAEAGLLVQVRSSFRSYAYQEQTFSYWVSTELSAGHSQEQAELIASTYSAQPGHSEHQLGTTADLTLGSDAVIHWLHNNAHRFGIVLTYGEDKIARTQYIYEPWHMRFVGVAAANDMQACQLNTEEFLSARYGVGDLPEYEGESLILYDDATFVEQVEPSFGAWYQPGTAIQVLWVIENSGTINWTDYRLVQISGDDFGMTSLDLVCVTAGEQVELALDLTAPMEVGRYESTWGIRNQEDELVGEPLSLSFEVATEAPEIGPLRYVRVDDLSNSTGGSDPGADLDAIVLRRGSERFYANAVEYYAATPSEVRAQDPTAILGAPDSFTQYPDVSTCALEGYVSLGGAGAIVVAMEEEIQPFDTIEVLEVGDCEYSPGNYAVIDQMEVMLSVAPELSGQWLVLGSGYGPLLSFEIPEL